METSDPLNRDHQFGAFTPEEGGFEGFFKTWYPRAHDAFGRLLERALQNREKPSRILDLGCGDGWATEKLAELTGGTYLGLDTSDAAVNATRQRNGTYPNLSVNAIRQEANWTVTPEAKTEILESLGGPPNVLLCNAALHQMVHSVEEAKSLLAAGADLCETGAVTFVADYFYSSDSSRQQIEKAYEWIRNTTGRAPLPAEDFLNPDQLIEAQQALGLHPICVEWVRANPQTVLWYGVTLSEKQVSGHE